MACLPWWGVTLLIIAAGALGFFVCVLYQWWLLSRPGAQPRG